MNERLPRPLSRLPLAAFDGIEDLLHYAVAAALVVLATSVLVRTVAHIVFRGGAFLPNVLETINGVLLVVIVLEILRTVLAHFTEGGFPLRYFLVIGVISATRHILTVAVHLSVAEHVSPPQPLGRLDVGRRLSGIPVVSATARSFELPRRVLGPDEERRLALPVSIVHVEAGR